MNRWIIPSVLAVSVAVGTMAVLVLLLAWRLRAPSSTAPRSSPTLLDRNSTLLRPALGVRVN